MGENIKELDNLVDAVRFDKYNLVVNKVWVPLIINCSILEAFNKYYYFFSILVVIGCWMLLVLDVARLLNCERSHIDFGAYCKWQVTNIIIIKTDVAI